MYLTEFSKQCQVKHYSWLSDLIHVKYIMFVVDQHVIYLIN